MADHNNAMAPAICGVAIDVPLANVYALSAVLSHERVLVPGAVISGFVRLLCISRDRAAAAKASNGIRAGVQSSHCIRSRIERRRIGHGGTTRPGVTRSYYHLDTGGFLSFNSGLQFQARYASFRDWATPGVDCNIRRFSRVAFVRACS